VCSLGTDWWFRAVLIKTQHTNWATSKRTRLMKSGKARNTKNSALPLFEAEAKLTSVPIARKEPRFGRELGLSNEQ
jgi:hypothetical protein